MRTGTWKGHLPHPADNRPRWIYGRNGYKPTVIVIHRMLGTLWGTDSWFRNPASGQTSTHFGVGYATLAASLVDLPSIWQWVNTNDTAYGWNARPSDTPTRDAQLALGNLLNIADLNWVAIHIEVANYGQMPANLADWYRQPWPPNLTNAVASLVQEIRKVHGPLPLLPHSSLSPKECPGATPWTLIDKRLPDTGSEEPDVYEWVATMKHQVPKRAIVRGGAVLYKDKVGGIPHYTLPADTEVEVISGTPGGWGARRPSGDGLFIVAAGDVKAWIKEPADTRLATAEQTIADLKTKISNAQAALR